MEIDDLMKWIDTNHEGIEFIFHIGAITDTSELDKVLLNRRNTQYTKYLWTRSIQYQIPIVYASSAATYGLEDVVSLATAPHHA